MKDPKDIRIEYRKPMFPIKDALQKYLQDNNRLTKARVFYEDLLRFSGYIALEDRNRNDTSWLRVYYSEFDRNEIEINLNKIYTLLHSDGDEDTLPYLTVDSIDFCTFGNSKPFRVKVRNILNDNYTHFYIKKVDASRIYGLELEDILSPYKINYLVYKDTLIEEHILGIPGDVFIKESLDNLSDLEKSQLAKEFVKFNERCMIGLLGDMRSYNYVIIPTHDFDQVVYRIRPIDFDQQCYEGNLKIYLPQYFKENFKMVKLVMDRLKTNSIEQYRKEVRSSVAKQILNSQDRFQQLIQVMKNDHIAPPENVVMLRTALQKFTKDVKFKHCQSMGEIVETGMNFVVKNYKKIV